VSHLSSDIFLISDIAHLHIPPSSPLHIRISNELDPPSSQSAHPPPPAILPVQLQGLLLYDYSFQAELIVANNGHSRNSMPISCSNSDQPGSRLYGNIPSSHPCTATMAITAKMTTSSHGSLPMRSRFLDLCSNPPHSSSKSNQRSNRIPHYHLPALKTYSNSTLIPMSKWTMGKVKRSRKWLLRTDHSLPYRLHRLGQTTPLHLFPLLELIRTNIKLFTMSIHNTDLPMRHTNAEPSRSRDMVLPLLPLHPTVVPLLPLILFDPSLVRMMLCKMRKKTSILPSGYNLLGRNGTNIQVIRLPVSELLDKLFLPRLTRTPTYRLSRSLYLDLAMYMAKKRPRRCSICIRPRLEVENPIDHLLPNLLMLPCLRMLGLLLRKKRRGVVEVIDLDP